MRSLYIPAIELKDSTVRFEFQRVSQAIQELGLMQVEQVSVPPEAPQAFQLLASNPPDWDPLTTGGAEPYLVYWDPRAEAWAGLGSGGSSDLTNYYTKSQVDALLAAKANSSDVNDQFGAVEAILDTLTEGLDDVVDDITNLQGDVDAVEDLQAQQGDDIADLLTTYGDTAAAAVSAAAAAASEAAAAAAEAAAIIAQAGAEAAKDDAVVAEVAAESARDDAGTSASAAATDAVSASSAATDAAAAAIAAETSRVEAVAAANAAVNAAQGGVTVDPAPGALFQFETDLDGWTGTPTPTWDSDQFINQATGANPVLTSPTIAANGAGYHEVVARIRRNAGSDWEGRVRYSTAGHGFSGTHELVIADPFLVNGEWGIISWDFSAVADWTASIITGLELQIGTNGGASDYDFDWIAVGNNLASLAQAAVTAASEAAASATDSANSASAASTSAASASSSATGAAGSASAASTSATSAATSASDSAASASAAQTDRIAAQTARSGAESAQTAAVSAKNSAEAASASASTSATNAANSATASAGSASAASGSASTASTSATNAAVSASAALASQVAASTSSTNAGNSASAAATSASSAAASSTSAGGSASAAAGSATQAATSAGNASTSANQASNSSTAAANASSNATTAASTANAAAATATTQASNAAGSAASASSSAALAAQSVASLASINSLNVVGNTTKWTNVNDVTLVNFGGRLIPWARNTSNGDVQLISDLFQLDPSAIYEVRMTVGKNLSGGQIYIGVYDETLANVQAVNNQADNGVTNNPYWIFINPPVAGQAYDCVFYLLGSAADITKVPDHKVTPNTGVFLQNGSGLKILSAGNKVQLRVLNWGNAGTNRVLHLTNVIVTRYDNKTSAEMKAESTVRAATDTAIASNVTTLTSTVNGNSASITTLNTSVNGVLGKSVLSINVNGFVTGWEFVNGGVGNSSFVILTDRFAIATPGVGTTFPFVVGVINGVNVVGINGNLVVSGTITSGALGAGALGADGVSNGGWIALQDAVAGVATPLDPILNGVTIRWGFTYSFVLDVFSVVQADYKIRIQLQVKLNGVWTSIRQTDYTVYSKFTGRSSPDFTTNKYLWEAADNDVQFYPYTPGSVSGVRIVGSVIANAGLSLLGSESVNFPHVYIDVDYSNSSKKTKPPNIIS